MRRLVAAAASGTLFGAGLAWSGMTNPARVLGFLDVAGGAWDPTLVLVMGGALAVTAPLFPLVLRRARPVLAAGFALPARSDLDLPLMAGAVVFGAGWGLAGLCPGPAIAGLVTGSAPLAGFVVAMIAGQWLARALARRPVRRQDG